MEIHELCSLFPEMTDAEFESLCDDVEKHGVVDPIITHENKIIDGRARYLASKRTGRLADFKEWDGQGGSVLGFIASRNLHRRNLSSGQRAAIALEIKNRLNVEYRSRMIANLKRGDSRQDDNIAPSEPANAVIEASKMAGSNPTYVNAVSNIRNASPRLFEDVKHGRKSIPQAKRELRWEKPLGGRREVSVERKRKPEDDKAKFIEESIEALKKIKNKCGCVEGMEEVSPIINEAIKVLKMAAIECLSNCHV